MKKKYQKIYKYNTAFTTLKDKLKDTSYGMCPAPLDDRTALNILEHYLLPDLQISMPISVEQANLVIVEQILDKYSKEWKQDWRHYTKHENQGCSN